MIGEDTFFTGCQLLMFSKDDLSIEDKNNLQTKTNFEILMSMMQEKNPFIQKNKSCIELVLLLLFPEYKVSFLPNSLGLIKDNQVLQINKDNFDKFQDILREMFALSEVFKGGNKSYNPGSKRAEKLVQKFNKYHQKLAEIKKQKGQGQNVTILSRYISILSVGETKDMNLLLQYSVFQLFDEFERFKLKLESDIYTQAKMAGAKGLKEADNWMKDIYFNSQE